MDWSHHEKPNQLYSFYYLCLHLIVICPYISLLRHMENIWLTRMIGVHPGVIACELHISSFPFFLSLLCSGEGSGEYIYSFRFSFIFSTQVETLWNWLEILWTWFETFWNWVVHLNQVQTFSNISKTPPWIELKFFKFDLKLFEIEP